MRLFQAATSIEMKSRAHGNRLVTLPRFIGMLHLLPACLLMISLASPASAQRVATVSADGTIRVLQNPDCVGDECRWVDIDRNSRSIALAATLDTIFQIHTSGAIWRWRGLPCADGECPSWTMIDNNPQSVEITAGHSKLFQRHRNGSIWRFTGADCRTDRCRGWRRIDNNPRTQSIVAAGDQLFQRHDNGSIWRWMGVDCDGDRCLSWQPLDNNPNTVAIDFADRGSLYQRHRDGSIWRWEGQPCTPRGCLSWSRIDRNPATVDILAAPGNLFQRHQAGAIWQWQGRPCEGSNCSFWTKVGDLPGLAAIAAGAQPRADVFIGDEGGPAPLYALFGNGRVARWTGEACTSSRCPNWTDVGRAFTRYRSDQSQLYVFTGRLPNPDDRVVLIPSQAGDEDGDGLPDDWKRQQTGLDVQLGRADLILVVVMRPELAANTALQNTLRENLFKAKEFFSSVPVRTARGARGIHLTVEFGRPLDDSFSESATPLRPYQEAREAGMPPELIGYAHGMLFGTDTGGGGQTSHPDWSGPGMDWRTIVHELGHQLGLGHTPPGATGQSPLYLSLMNYDYNHGIAGDPNQIRFSDGRFSSLRLDERNLNEILPFTRDQLAFLTFGPYNFDVQRIDNGSASVDWNRNGVHGERGISANINDGYALGVGQWNHVGHTHGNVAVASAGSNFVVVRSLIHRVDSRDYAGLGPSPSTPARLMTTTLRDREILNTGVLVRQAFVTGSPTALAVEGGMLIAAPSVFGTAQLGMFTIASDGNLEGSMRSSPIGGHREMVLVGTASDAKMILWDPDSKHLSVRSIVSGSRPSLGEEQAILGADGNALASAGPPGATFNSRTGQIILLTSESDGHNPDRLKLHPIRPSGSRYVAETGRWLADSGARSLDRPEIIFDGSNRAGGEGRYLVYFRRSEGEASQGYHQMHFVRVSLPRTTGSRPEDPYVFRRRMVINEWVRTRSAPAVAPYRDDFVLAWRVSDNRDDETTRNQTEVNFFASGEFASGPADHDDITHIAQRGLRRIATLRR